MRSSGGSLGGLARRGRAARQRPSGPAPAGALPGRRRRDHRRRARRRDVERPLPLRPLRRDADHERHGLARPPRPAPPRRAPAQHRICSPPRQARRLPGGAQEDAATTRLVQRARAGGFVCAKFATLDVNHQVRNAPHPPELSGHSPTTTRSTSPTARRWQKLPSVAQQLRLEPWLTRRRAPRPDPCRSTSRTRAR